jgi:glutamyl/glutaminyl-tRNA synthetase
LKELKTLLLEKYGEKVASEIDDSKTLEYMTWSQLRIHFLPELIEEHGYLWKKPGLDFPLKEFEKSLGPLGPLLNKVTDILKQENMNTSCLKSFSKENKLKFSSLMHLLRCCLTNKAEGPPIKDIVTLLGKDASLERLKAAALHFSKKVN